MSTLTEKIRFLARTGSISLIGGSAVVLAYHRVTDAPTTDPMRLIVSRSLFLEQMTMLAQRYTPISIQSLCGGLSAKNLPRRAVAVTFDDGYADGLTEVAPLLSALEIPATFFVASGQIEAGREYWWDELERVLLAPKSLPRLLTVRTENVSLSVDLGESAELESADLAAQHSWDITMPPENLRQRAYLTLSNAIKPLSPRERSWVIDSLSSQAEMTLGVRDTHRLLTKRELRLLSQHTGMSVGGHTSSHEMLEARTPVEQEETISQDHDWISAAIGMPPTAFAYPYGSVRDFSTAARQAVARSGYSCAVTTIEDTVKPWTDPYAIPRHTVGRWGATELARRLDGWFAGRY